MSTDRDMARIVRSWLRTDEHESADRVLDNVLALLDATPQRRPSWSARRIADMNNIAKFAVAAAAIALVAVVGFAVVRPEGGPGSGPGGSPSPTLAATPSSGPTSASRPSPAGVFPSAGPIQPGRQRFSEDDIVFSFEVPDGWSAQRAPLGGVWLTKGKDGTPTGAWMPIWSVDGVASDPCAAVAAPVAASPAELADDVAALPGTDVVTAPEDVTVGGRPAKHVAITIRDDIACSPGQFKMWYVGTADSHIFRFATALNQTDHVWILDVDGRHFWLEIDTFEGADPSLLAEIQAMVDSIEFE